MYNAFSKVFPRAKMSRSHLDCRQLSPYRIAEGLLVTREKAPHSYHFVVNPSHFSAHRAATPRTDNHPSTWSVSEIRVTSPL
jgi:hypothetical protein